MAHAQPTRQNSIVQPAVYVTRAARDAAPRIAADAMRSSAAASYARRRSGRSAWDDGTLAAVFAAWEAVLDEDVKLLFAIEKDDGVPALPEWIRDAIDEEMELEQRSIGREAFEAKMTGSVCGVSRERLDVFVELVQRVDLTAEQRKLLEEISDDLREERALRHRQQALQDPSRQEVRKRVMIAAAVRGHDAKLALSDVSDDEANSALRFWETCVRYAEEIRAARSTASAGRRGRREGSRDETRFFFYLGLLIEFRARGYRPPTALDAAEIALVRGYQSTTDCVALEKTWRSWREYYQAEIEWATARLPAKPLVTPAASTQIKSTKARSPSKRRTI